MFVRVKTINQDGRSYEYLQIVRSVRDGGRVRQELVASFGRRDLLIATGKLDQLVQALARFSTRLKVIEAAKDERLVAREARSWGPALVFGRLWQQQGLPEILDRHAEGRRFGFDFERVAFALALQRLCAPGSDLQVAVAGRARLPDARVDPRRPPGLPPARRQRDRPHRRLLPGAAPRGRPPAPARRQGPVAVHGCETPRCGFMRLGAARAAPL